MRAWAEVADFLEDRNGTTEEVLPSEFLISPRYNANAFIDWLYDQLLQWELDTQMRRLEAAQREARQSMWEQQAQERNVFAVPSSTVESLDVLLVRHRTNTGPGILSVALNFNVIGALSHFTVMRCNEEHEEQ